MITREQARRLAKVATAIAEGKRVTYTDRIGNIWEINGVSALWADSIYTIHEPPPEPKYRPWTLEEAIDNIGRVVRSRNDRAARLITAVHDHCGEALVRLGGGLDTVYAADELMSLYCFLDGTPCGVRE